mmetsp:Transcript_17400/g.66282  ORF Transcript_17400/g.66282 Transcript_17400/m.66282 type:complete len:359 (-) Transcript_17400:7-1083(-)
MNSEQRFVEKAVCGRHLRTVSSVKFSLDGRLLVSGGADGVAKLWRGSDGKELSVMDGHSQGISDVAISNDGSVVATASDDRSVGIWDTETRTKIHSCSGHTSYVFCVRFNPRCNLLASGSFDEHVRFWDPRTGTCVRQIAAHSDPVTSVDFNARDDDARLVSSSHDGLMRIWDVGSGLCITTLFAEMTPAVSSVRYTPNGRYILSNTLDSKIRLWDYANPTKCVKLYKGHLNEKYCCVSDFAVASVKMVVSGSEDGCIYLWDLQTRKLLQRLRTGTSVVLSVATHPKADIIASGGGGGDNVVQLWEFRYRDEGEKPSERIQQSDAQPSESMKQEDLAVATSAVVASSTAAAHVTPQQT